MTENLTDHLRQLATEMNEYKQKVAFFENSASWRMTKPLRQISTRIPFLMKMARRLKHIFMRRSPSSQVLPAVTGPTSIAAEAVVPFTFPDMFALTGFKATANIAVMLHMNGLENWSETLELLKKIPGPFDLFVGLISGKNEPLKSSIIQDFPTAMIRVFPNTGNTLLPLVCYVNTGTFNQYDMVLKLDVEALNHSQKNQLGPLIKQCIQTMRDNRNIGLIGPTGSIQTVLQGLPQVEARFSAWAALLDEPVVEGPASYMTGPFYLINPFILRMLQTVRLTVTDLITNGPEGPAMIERLLSLFCGSAAMQRSEVSENLSAPPIVVRTPKKNNIKIIAFYLPQFFPTPENDSWWGKGFTEWTFVSQAKPLFDRHHQPKLPADLGFYDLRLPEAREAQAELAKAHGVGGFCYHYYWFDIGKRILDRPLREIRETGKPDFPFCICWANHHWSRRWDGLEQEILLEQKYSYESCKLMVRDLIPFFRDPRYVRHQGRPVFIIYCLLRVPHYRDMCEMWREECYQAGIGEIHIATYDWNTVPELKIEGPLKDLGIDALIDSPPLSTKQFYNLGVPIHASRKNLNPSFTGAIYDYGEEVDFDLARYKRPEEIIYRHRGLMVGFDNTPRRKENATIYYGSNPAKFRRWLAGIIDQEAEFRKEAESLIFIQAWNEWAEGNMLEPDHKFGRGYLEAIKSCMQC